MCMCSWGKLWTRYKKTKNPTVMSKEPGAKEGCWEQKQGMAHAPLHTRPPNRWVNHQSHPSGQLLDPSLPSSHVRNQLASPED